MSSPWEVEASSGGGSSEVPPEGNHPAVLVGLIDLGTHQEQFQGEAPYDARKALFVWELPGEHKADGSPFFVSQSYTLMPKISGKSALRKMMESWRGKPYADGEKIDVSVLVGKSCLLNIGHGLSAKKNPFAKILGIGPMPRGMRAPTPFTPTFTWTFSDGTPTIPDWVPWLFGEPVEAVIMRSREAGGPAGGREPQMAGAGAGVNGAAPMADSDIPF